MPDWQEWKDYAAKQPRLAAQNPRFAQIQRDVAARMERLLDGDEWATYVRLVEGLIEETEALLGETRTRLEREQLPPDQTMVLVGVTRECRTSIECYRRVLDLPRHAMAEAPKVEAAAAV